MAVKTMWTVEHSCGHRQDHDLSDRRPSERAGFGRWLAEKECADCWYRRRDRENARSRETWVTEQRAKEGVEVEGWEEACGMPVLEGSDKAVAWGRVVRHRLMNAAHEYGAGIGIADEDFAEWVEVPARRIISASWWIDQRDAAPDDVAELVVDGSVGLASVTGSENPY